MSKPPEDIVGVMRVFITDLMCPARVGVHDYEKHAPRMVRINLDLGVRDAHVESDRLEEVVCYDQIADRVRAVALERHNNLVETLAERIAEACFEDSRVLSARVRVDKPGAMPDAASAGAEIERRREAR